MAADLPYRIPRRVTVQPGVAERAVTVGVLVATSTEATPNTAVAAGAEVALIKAVKLEMAVLQSLERVAAAAGAKIPLPPPAAMVVPGVLTQRGR